METKASNICDFEKGYSRVEMIGELQPGNYKLSVRGEGGIDFQSETNLVYARKSYAVFIQTDKSVYKPGNTILFRALILSPHLKPTSEVTNEPIFVYVQDGQGNRVKEWRDVSIPKGVFTGELRLSDSPVLGTWTITVVTHDQRFNKTVDVALYVLPKFIIKIDAPKHITFLENIITAQITTYYDYGKKVRGDATITVYPTIYSGVIQPFLTNQIRKVIPIDGSATINFDIDKELNLNDEYERRVIIDVAIEEALTGRRQNASVEVQIHKYDYKMELIKTADYYKPGLPYTAYVKVSNHDLTPLRKDQNMVKIKYGYSRADEVYLESTVELDKHGLAKLEMIPPVDSTNETALRVEAEYLELKERMSPVPAAVSPSKVFMQVSLETGRPLLGLDIIVLVNCTEPMKYISYELLARGDILKADSLQVDNSKVHRFRLQAVYAMVPVSHLLISYVRENGELISDSLDIETEDRRDTQNEIILSTEETQPENDVDITVLSKPNAYVGILAVDQNINTLRSGYDMSMDDIFNELERFDRAITSPYSTIMKNSKSDYFWKPGTSNNKDMFTDSGAVLITNSLVTKRRPTLEDIYLRPVSYGSSTVKPDLGFGLSFKPATRPPSDNGPFAFSRIPRQVWDKPRVYLMQNIFDTWIFTNFSTSSEGKARIRRRVPNSLTNWLISGFTLDRVSGLKLMPQSKLLKVTKQLAISIDLPKAVQRDEILAIPVVVYNNLNRDIDVKVTFYNNEQKFQFAEVSNQVNSSTQTIELYRRKKVNVGKSSKASTSFLITPTKIGLTEIKVTATYSSSQDTLTKMLNVKAEGETEYYSKSILIDLRRKPSFSGNITIDIPRNKVEDSEKIEISTVSDLLGPLLINIDNLIRLPTACGEQNLIHFVPDLVLLNYLKNTGQKTPTIEMEAVKLLEVGYQKQLSYKKLDGSFSAFGRKDEVGSVWITSYTVLSLIQAKPYIYVDEIIIAKGLEWLADNQSPNGSFTEIGPIIHRDVQTNAVALTAFTLTVFLENRKTSSQYTNLISKGLDFVARYMYEEDQDIYSIALAAYVLQISNHQLSSQALTKLMSKVKTKNDMKWWGKDIPEDETKNPWNYLPNSMNIEITSYALLAYLEADLLDEAMPIVNWLVNQGNNLGGFVSTQDTRMALMALYRLVLRLSIESSMQITYQYRKQDNGQFSINKNNALIVQEAKLGNEARVINITAQGQGIALVKVNYQYNMNVTGPWPMFTLDPQVDKNSNEHHLQLSICTAFVSRNLSENSASNMAVMEVNLPSGFTVDVDSLPSLEVSQNVQKVETKNDTTVVLYFHNTTIQEYCPTVSAFRTHKVAKQKPVAVTIYDYYDSSRKARVFYGGNKKTTLCDICEDEDCGDICSLEPVPRPLNSSSISYPATITTTMFVVVYALH
ncbi:macroglobulin / complement [Holotrichia oblita]|uniref:Macroglobulin / complement n=1 Tax=Holotrichia oblita TaxID=644536 RepID=A0ACB9TDF5_HOLOL|nr:macroglobulin / complement [Holotrichia oblita]